MLMKLVMPPHNRVVRGGRVLKWYKAPGDRVAYADDLLDVRIDEAWMQRTAADGWSREQVEALIRAQARHLAMPPRPAAPPTLAPGQRPPFHHVVRVAFDLRISSSDAGTLLKICAAEGDEFEIGSLLAILATGDDEGVPGEGFDPDRASSFRAFVTEVSDFEEI